MIVEGRKVSDRTTVPMQLDDDGNVIIGGIVGIECDNLATESTLAVIAGAVSDSKVQVDVVSMPPITVEADVDLDHEGDSVLIYANTAKDGSGDSFVPLLDSDGHLQIDVLSGDITIGAALPAGANTIGAVNLAQYTPVSGRLPVDGSGVTQPVSLASVPSHDVTSTGTFAVQAEQSGSWTVTANAGTNLNTSALALETTASAIKDAAEAIEMDVAALAGTVDDGKVQVDVVGTVEVDTELPTAAVITGDNAAAPTAPAVYAFGLAFDGSAWDRIRGDSTNGMLVNLGSNNDVTVTNTVDIAGEVTISGTVTVDTELPGASAVGDATANPSISAISTYGLVFNGTAWDRIRGDATDGVLVNLGTNNEVVVSAFPADVFEFSNADALAVSIVDGDGDPITSFGGGVQYDEGDTDATPTGTLAMWSDTSDTLRATSASKPMPVQIMRLYGNSQVNSALFQRSRHFAASVTAKTEIVNFGAASDGIELDYLEVSNPNEADCFIQIFFSPAESVELGTTPPDMSFLIPAGADGKRGAFDRIFGRSIFSTTGLTYAITTTPTGSTAPASGVTVNIGGTWLE